MVPKLYAKAAVGGLTTKLGSGESVSTTGTISGLFPASGELMMIEDWYRPADSPPGVTETVIVAGVLLPLVATVNTPPPPEATTDSIGNTVPSLLVSVIC
jgi:hypothetical protein